MSTTMILGNLAIGPLLLLISLVCRAFPPKKINTLYGYRTSKSMKSQEVWHAANKYATNLMLWVSIITIASQVLLILIFNETTGILAASGIMIVLLISIILKVEKYLDENFDSEGRPITKKQ